MKLLVEKGETPPVLKYYTTIKKPLFHLYAERIPRDLEVVECNVHVMFGGIGRGKRDIIYSTSLHRNLRSH